jgi:hypothetical protein
MGSVGREREISWLRRRYKEAKRKEKTEILTEVVERFSVGRRQAKRLMNEESTRGRSKPSQRGRPSKYQDPEFIKALRVVWKSTKFMCSRHLKAAMPEWLPFVEKEYGCFSNEIRQKLLTVSAPTMDRLLKRYRAIRGKSFTRSGGFRDEIPIQGNVWDISVPGYLESDTVAHCGGSTAGEFVYTVTMVDIATIWTETRAVFGKGSTNIVNAIEDIELRLPFPILGYDSDNGTEVLNSHILRYFRDERIERGLEPVLVTRAKEYDKNSQAHVEQRNDSVARKYLGYERLDYAELVPLINHYYIDVVCPLINHFFPTFKLKDKVLIKARKKRIYDKPVTPYVRIMASAEVSDERKHKLKQVHESLNPVELSKREFKLRHQVDQALKRLRNAQSVSHLIVHPTPTPPSVTHRPLRREASHPFSRHVHNCPAKEHMHQITDHNFRDMNYEP